MEEPSSLLALTCPVCDAPAVGALECPKCGTALLDDRIGEVLDGGRWRVDRLLGQGGIGRVYRGTDLASATGASVAIKFLLEKWLASPEQVERFRREALALERLRHDSIVRLLALGDAAGVPYLVLERLRGRTLAQAVAEEAPTPRRVFGVLDQVLSAVDAAHGAGVVHRDLKPDNVMLLDDEVVPSGSAAGAPRVKVLDFGIALFDDPSAPRLTQLGDVRGTPVYMSPEQCRGRAVGPASDVYSLGVVLYELLVGERPFRGATTLDLIEAHVHQPPPPLDGRAPAGLAEVALAALAKAPEHRPSAYAMRVSLERAVVDLGRAAEEPLPRRSRRTPAAPSVVTKVEKVRPPANDEERAAAKGGVRSLFRKLLHKD